MTPWKMGTAYQCFSRIYHLTHLNKRLRVIQQKEWKTKSNLREVEEQGCGAQQQKPCKCGWKELGFGFAFWHRGAAPTSLYHPRFWVMHRWLGNLTLSFLQGSHTQPNKNASPTTDNMSRKMSYLMSCLFNSNLFIITRPTLSLNNPFKLQSKCSSIVLTSAKKDT